MAPTEVAAAAGEEVGVNRQEKRAARAAEKRSKKSKARLRQEAAKSARLWKETGGRCVYCNEGVREELRTWEHLWPKSRGGSNGYGNLLPACAPCNHRRGVQWPASPLAHPRWVGVVRAREAAQGWMHQDDPLVVAGCKALAGRVPMKMVMHLAGDAEHSSRYVNVALEIGMECHVPVDKQTAKWGMFTPSKTEPVRRWWYRERPEDVPMYATLWELLMFDEEVRERAAAMYPEGGKEGP